MKLIKKIMDLPFFYNITQTLLGMDFFNVAKKYIEQYPHESILEIGCGPEGIIRHIKTKNYLGIDINASYIKNAKKKYEKNNIRFLKCDSKKIGKIKQFFDILLIINVIHHISDKDLDSILKRLASNVKFDRIIVFDGKPDIGIFSGILERLDQGNNFRELPAIENIFKRHFIIETSRVIRKPYWIYKSPLIIARKK